LSQKAASRTRGPYPEGYEIPPEGQAEKSQQYEPRSREKSISQCGVGHREEACPVDDCGLNDACTESDKDTWAYVSAPMQGCAVTVCQRNSCLILPQVD